MAEHHDQQGCCNEDSPEPVSEVTTHDDRWSGKERV